MAARRRAGGRDAAGLPAAPRPTSPSPAPATSTRSRTLLSSRAVDVLIFNTPDRGRRARRSCAAAAEQAGVPVVEVTETVAAGVDGLRRLAGRPAPRAGDGARCDVSGQAPATPALVLEDVARGPGRAARLVRGRRSRSRAGAIVGVIGPERLGQDHAAPDAARPAPAGVGPDDGPRATRPTGATRASATCPRTTRPRSARPSACRDLVALGLTGARWGLGRTSAPRTGRRVDAALGRRRRQRVRRPPHVHACRAASSSGSPSPRRWSGDPELLLLDEPLANLDVRNQHEIVGAARAASSGRAATSPSWSSPTTSTRCCRCSPAPSTCSTATPTTAPSATSSTRSCSPTSTARRVRVVAHAQGDLFTRSGR